MPRTILGTLTALCATIAGVAICQTVEAAQSSLSPEEATLLLIYAIPPGSVPKTAEAYVIDWTGETAGQPTRKTMRVHRDAGCRVVLESRIVSEADPGAVLLETRTYDWSAVNVDEITVSQVAVPGQGYEAYNVDIKLPGQVQSGRDVRQTAHAVQVLSSSASAGPLEFQWPYVPGHASTYSINREPFLELMRRCAGGEPRLPELRGAAPLRAFEAKPEEAGRPLRQ